MSQRVEHPAFRPSGRQSAALRSHSPALAVVQNLLGDLPPSV
jgi:hypothetical protein